MVLLRHLTHHRNTHALPAKHITLPCAHADLFTLNTHSHTHALGGEGGRSGLEVVKGAVCYVMEGRNGFALSDRAVTTALFHV